MAKPDAAILNNSPTGTSELRKGGILIRIDILIA
jgi:hypothetical protein